MPKLLTDGEKRKAGTLKEETGGEDGSQKAAREEMRTLIEQVRPKGLRERMMRVWERWRGI